MLVAGSRADDVRRVCEELSRLHGVPMVATVRRCLDSSIRFAAESRPDVVLFDLDLQNGAGGGGLSALVAAAGSAPVIAFGDEERRTAALLAGATDWVNREDLRDLRVLRTLEEVRAKHLSAVKDHLLNRLPVLLAESSDLSTILTLALAELCKSTGWRLGEAWLPADADRGRLRRAASWASALPDRHDFEVMSRQIAFAPGEGLPGRVWSWMRPIWLTDVCRCSWYQRGIPAYRAGLRTAIGLPVRFKGAPAAVLVLYADHVRERNDDVVEMLSAATGPLGALLAAHRSTTAADRVREELESMADTLAEGVMIVNGDGDITFANAEVGRILNRDARAMIGRKLEEFDDTLYTAEGEPYEDREDAPIARAFRERRPIREAVVGLEKPDGGGLTIVSVNAAPYFDASGELTRVIASFRDITEQQRTTRELAHSRERFARAFEANPLAMGITTLDECRFLEANEGLEALFGLPRERIVGHRLADLPVQLEPGAIEGVEEAIASGERVRGSEFSLETAAGSRRQVRFSGVGIRLEGQTCLLGVVEDITEQQRIERELHELALRDGLTGLPNRNLFDDRLLHAYESAEQGRESIAVMFIDLDRFKVVNDSLGHAAGDELLASVADRLQACFREHDTVARVGGDEFAVVLENVKSPAEIERMGDRIIEAFGPGFDVRNKTVHLTPSIGVAFGSSQIERAADLLRFADVAMYRTKAEGGNGLSIFDLAIDSGATRRLTRETALRTAIENEELTVRYQPVISCRDGRVVGAEALVRWEHPDEGTIPPGQFIPLAEETGLIIPLGRFVLREAARQVMRWRPRGSSECPFRISVNVSPRQMRCPRFLTDLRGILEETGTPPPALLLELTEGVLIRNPETAAALRELGVLIAVDDLGTGYASLEYLTRLDVDLLKLDHTFVRGLGSDRAKSAIVESVLLLADRLGIPLVAEGIETEEQLRRLRELHCNYGQGYHISRPLAPREFERFLAERPTW